MPAASVTAETAITAECVRQCLVRGLAVEQLAAPARLRGPCREVDDERFPNRRIDRCLWLVADPQDLWDRFNKHPVQAAAMTFDVAEKRVVATAPAHRIFRAYWGLTISHANRNYATKLSIALITACKSDGKIVAFRPNATPSVL